MAVDPHFHPARQRLSLSEIITLCDARLYSDGHQGDITHGCAPNEASTGAVVLVGSQSYLEQCTSSDNYTIITSEELASYCPEQCTILIAQNPRLAFARALQHLYKDETTSGIAASASISASAILGNNISIGEGVIIEEGVQIGDHAVIGHHCVIGKYCQIGDHVTIADHACIYYTKISNGASIGHHSVIGKEGFGFEMTEEGAVKLPHLGFVDIGAHADIGANCVIDRGVLGNTIIGKNVMIDNQVHIAHNVEIAEKSLILAQVGIAGSTKIGKNTIIGGQVGIKDHINIADNVMVMSGSKVTKSIITAGAYVGFPAQESRQYWREMAAMKKLIKKS